MNFEEIYSRKEFQNFLKYEFLSDEFIIKDETITLENYNNKIQNVTLIGQDPRFDLKIYEIIHESENDPRVTLSKETFRMMKNQGLSNALAIFKSQNSKEYRFSYLTIDVESEDGRLRSKISNPRRYSFLLGPNTKIHTPKKFLSGKIKDLDDLKARFSIEIVNKQFYSEIAELFSELVEKIKLPSVSDEKTKQEFVVRLIGRIIFSWFLKKKKSESGIPLISEEVLSSKSIDKNPEYYHNILEPLFFEILNTEKDKRNSKFENRSFDNIPFLNGGLFEPQSRDYYEFDPFTGYSKYINTLKVSDGWIKNLFEVLELYNFTIDENTPIDVELSIDPEMLGRIFENLLAEINPETKKSARKSTGSYYTPREIVEYMVNESLKYFLKSKTSLEEEEIKSLLSYSMDSKITEEKSDEIINALEKLKILDPACGSGAFPIGILQKVVLILNKVDPDSKKWKERQIQDADSIVKSIIEEKLEGENAEFIRKLGIIERTIYGVDIQEIAIEISKLRVFLSLMVEANVSDTKENRGIKVLPNLEFKFVCANTLKKLPGLEWVIPKKKNRTNNQIGWFENDEPINELKKLREKYFISHGKGKKEIEEEFKQVQTKMLTGLNFKSGTLNTQTSMLSFWDPFSFKKSEWFDPKWMFGVENGFDIVIANPPYIQLQKNHGKLADIYKNQDFKTYTRTGDIYILFYEKGINLLKKDGYLCFITSNKWMRVKYGEKLREYISKYDPLILIDLGSGVFENATVDTNILIIRKTNNKSKLKGVTLSSQKSLSELGDNDFMFLPNFGVDIWFIDDNSFVNLKKKIEKIGKPLKTLDMNIYRGILTGLNKAFIINSDKRQEILNNCENDEERERTEGIIKPILRGRDIIKYKYEWSNLWIIFIPWHFPLSNDLRILGSSLEAEFEFQKYYPSLYEHFSMYKNELMNRNKSETGIKYEWYALQRYASSYYSEFEKEKVIWQEISEEPGFSYDENSMFCNDTGRIMTGKNIKFFVALFNSLFFKNIFSKFYAGGNLGNKGIRFKHTFMEAFPIPQITNKNESVVKQIEILIDKIFSVKKSNPNTNTSKYEYQIDQLVYKLYDLTENEIKIIEKI